MGFPCGTTLWDLNGVPVVLGPDGNCCALNPSEISPAKLYISGKLLTENGFHELIGRQRRLPNSMFAPGVDFREKDGVLVVVDALGSATALDGSFTSRVMPHDFGAPLSERAFLDRLTNRLRAAAKS